MADMLGSLRQARPATMAMCPHAQLLAVTPKAGLGDSGSSRLQIVKLWKSKYDPPRGRHLEVIADIPFADGDLHRLVWSRNNDCTAYRVGLLAGGFDGGVVIWKARDLTYHYSVNDTYYFEVPKFENPNRTDIRKNALDISRDVERIYMNQLDETLNDWHIVEDNCKTEVGDWELVSKDQLENMKPAALIRHKSSGEPVDFEKPSLLKIADLEGPVRGLAFNNQYTNMLAAAGKADKLNIYHIDYPAKDSTRKYEFADDSEKAKNARVTFLEWHPHYPAILASTCDAGITTMWDIRRKKPVLRFEDTNQHCTEVRWSPNEPLHLAVSSIGQSSDTVKIWDLGKTGKTDKKYQKSPIAQFGPTRGVTSLSWSVAYNLILTTDVDGATDCWSVDGKEREGLCGDDSESLEARWCETTDHEFAVSTTTGVELCRLPLWGIRDGI